MSAVTLSETVTSPGAETAGPTLVFQHKGMFGTRVSLALFPGKHTLLLKEICKLCAKVDPDLVGKERWAEGRSL